MKAKYLLTITKIPVNIFIFSILLFSFINSNANSYSNGAITIDTEFTIGSLGDTISSIHNNLSDIKYLSVSVGTLSDADIFWIRDNLVNLLTLKIWDEANISNSSLPDNAFKNHTNIYSCYFENVTSLGNNAFKGSSNLFDARFIQLTSIGDSAFAGCNYFCKLAINSAHPPVVGEGAFEDCYYYRQLRLPYEGKIACQAADDGNTADDYWYGFELIVPFENNVTIKQIFTSGDLSVSVSALRNDLLAITNLTITKGVLNTQDVYWIRDNLLNLEILTINEDATFSDGGLPDSAFKNLQNLQFVNVSNAAFIGNNAFENCINVVTVYAYSATSLGNHAFKNCYNCNQLYLDKYSPPSIGNGTFEGCTVNKKIIDLGHPNNCNPDAYRAVNDGDTYDNYWYGWEIKVGGTTVIQVNTDEGGNMDWGQPSAWDTIYENVNGAAFWNGEDWVVNDTYGHMFFEDTRITGFRRIGNYGGINYQIPTEPTISEGRIIGGYFISAEEYGYTVDAIDGGKYNYTGIKYRIDQPDGTSIMAHSRGNGNGTDSAYFDIVLEDTSPGPGITTFREGGVVSDATGFTLNEAVSKPLVDSLVMGRLVTSKLTNNENRYFIDTNGGNEMGGMSYIINTHFMPPAKTVESYEIAQTYVSDFSVHFKNNEGQLESFKISPLLISEVYSPPTGIKNNDLASIDISPLILYPNPTTNKLNIKSGNIINGAIIKIYDINGNIVLNKTYCPPTCIDVSAFTPGFYHVQLENEAELFYSRFVKQ